MAPNTSYNTRKRDRISDSPPSAVVEPRLMQLSGLVMNCKDVGLIAYLSKLEGEWRSKFYLDVYSMGMTAVMYNVYIYIHIL